MCRKSKSRREPGAARSATEASRVDTAACRGTALQHACSCVSWGEEALEGWCTRAPWPSAWRPMAMVKRCHGRGLALRAVLAAPYWACRTSFTIRPLSPLESSPNLWQVVDQPLAGEQGALGGVKAGASQRRAEHDVRQVSCHVDGAGQLLRPRQHRPAHGSKKNEQPVHIKIDQKKCFHKCTHIL